MSQEKQPASQPTAPPPTKSLTMVWSMVGVAAISGLLIVMAFQVTLPIIKKNKAEALKKALFEVIPEARKVQTFILEKNGAISLLEGEDEKSVKFYAGYDDEGELAGIAIEAQGYGYQDIIKIIYGYSPEKQNIIGMKVLESKETPGLGDKIAKDPVFLANFKALDVTLVPGEEKLVNPLKVVKKGRKTKPWQIDAITGATISSKAIGKMLNRNTPKRLSQAVKNLAAFKEMKIIPPSKEPQ